MFNIPNEILIMRFLVVLAVIATMASWILIMIGGDFSRAWENDIEFKINCLRVSNFNASRIMDRNLWSMVRPGSPRDVITLMTYHSACWRTYVYCST